MAPLALAQSSLQQVLSNYERLLDAMFIGKPFTLPLVFGQALFSHFRLGISHLSESIIPFALP